MKKAILILAAVITFSAVATAQYTKPDIKGVANKAALATDKEFGLKAPIKELPRQVGDTLEIPKDAKFIKVNGKTIDVNLLNNALLVLTDKDVEAFLTSLQEFPAKIANPFTQYFLKYFGLTTNEPKK